MKLLGIHSAFAFLCLLVKTCLRSAYTHVFLAYTRPSQCHQWAEDWRHHAVLVDVALACSVQHEVDVLQSLFVAFPVQVDREVAAAEAATAMPTRFHHGTSGFHD